MVSALLSAVPSTFSRGQFSAFRSKSSEKISASSQQPSSTELSTVVGGFDPATDLSNALSERLALKVRSKTRVRVDDEGNLRATSRTKLRFRYDLETNDGQKLSLRAKANVKQTLVQDEDGAFSLQTKVKFQFRLIQQDVNAGINSLNPNESENRSLEAFTRQVDRLSSQFSDEGSIDADELIASVLDAFNQLYERFSGNEPAAERPEENEVDAVSVRVRLQNTSITANVGQSDVPIAEVPDVETDSSQPVDNVEAAVGTVESSEDVDDVDEPDDDDAVEEARDDDDREERSSSVADSGKQDETTAPSDPSSEPVDRREVLQQVRVRFVQSFSQVVQTLSPENGSGDNLTLVQQQSSLKFSARVSYLA
ncbi:MAG: hypothetical protein AAGG48_24825 [Planctomycetota bacterium]